MLLKFGFEFFCCVFLLGRCLRCGRENVVESLLAFAMQMRHGHQVMKSGNFRQIDFFFYLLPVEMELCQKLIVSIICPKFFRTQAEGVSEAGGASPKLISDSCFSSRAIASVTFLLLAFSLFS